MILGGFFSPSRLLHRLNLAGSLVFRGIAAIVEAYLIYWAVVYFVARKWFGFSREWSGAARVGHFDLRRRGRDRDRRRNPRAAGGAGVGSPRSS